MRSGFTLTHLLFVVGLITVVAALCVPSLASSRRASNERNASTTLKTLSSAEADFRANDRDGNGVNDFWTADVKGLFTLTSAALRGSGDPSIRLIELTVAAADADGTFFPAGGENRPLRDFSPRDCAHGYWFAALVKDRSEFATSQPVYRQDTGGQPPMGRVHHHAKFGFVALPDARGERVDTVWINENNSLFWTRNETPLQPGTVLPARLGGDAAPSFDWPDDDFRRNNFCRK